jgi:hypothetical protein
VQALAGCVCGDDPSEYFGYRRHVDIDDFFAFTGVEVNEPEPEGLSRWNRAAWFIDRCQRSEQSGSSGLPTNIEAFLRALLDRREFDSEDGHDRALLHVNEILRGMPVEIRAVPCGAVEVVSTTRTQAQEVLDAQIHTVFGVALADSELDAARTHYAKAKRYLEAAVPDYENAAKEAVSSVESLVRALTAEKDYTAAIKGATRAGLIPRPLDDIAIKLYAYRGNEPGVAHGSPEAPAVKKAEAELVFNLAGALGAYLAVALRAEPLAGS